MAAKKQCGSLSGLISWRMREGICVILVLVLFRCTISATGMHPRSSALSTLVKLVSSFPRKSERTIKRVGGLFLRERVCVCT